MSWGIELWDQYDMVMIHTHNGIDFLERFGNFLKERCAVELEYASKLRKLAKSYLPKKKEEEDYQFSSYKAFKEMLNGITELAERHESVSEKFTSNIAKEVSATVKEIKDEKRKYRQKASELQMNLMTQMSALSRAKKNCHKSHKEAGKAVENYERADVNLVSSGAVIEKQRMNLHVRSEQCEVSKNEYINQLQKINKLQSVHYHVLMPSVLTGLQEMDERRIKKTKEFMKRAVRIETNALLVMKECLDVILTCSDSINEEEDSRLVIKRYKSGNKLPGDIPFVDLCTVKHSYSPSSNVSPTNIGSSENSLTSVSTVRSSESLLTLVDPGIMAQPSAPLLPMPEMPCLIPDVPPSYEDSVSGAANYHEEQNFCTTFHGHMLSSEAWTPELMGRSGQQEDGRQQRLKDLASSIGTPQNSSSSNRESGFESSQASFSDSEFDSSGDEEDDTVNEERLPVLGTCKAKYKFTATTEGSISLHEEEMVSVIEFDTGSGWTGVRRKRDSVEGFVPTSYLDWAVFNNSQNGLPSVFATT